MFVQIKIVNFWVKILSFDKWKCYLCILSFNQLIVFADQVQNTST